MVASSATGKTWSAPEPVDNGMSAGHQVMPSIAFAGGRLMVAYHDFREGVSQLFRPWIEETSVHMLATKRHTVDVRAAQANRAPIRGAMRRCGCPSTCGAAVPGVGPRPVEQLQFNPPNLKVFELGTVPFFGDYIDLAPSPAFVPVAGGWTYNTAPSSSPLFHAVWTDNRDVVAPFDGDWTKYTPPGDYGRTRRATRTRRRSSSRHLHHRRCVLDERQSHRFRGARVHSG